MQSLARTSPSPGRLQQGRALPARSRLSKMAASMFTRWLHKTAARSPRPCRSLVLSSNYSIDEHLSKHEYWKQRYSQPSTDLSFDWFLESPEILDFLLDSIQHCRPGHKQPVSCVDLGCGTSSVPRSILAHSPVAVSLVLLDFVHEALQFQKQHVNTAAAAVPESCCHFVCAGVTCPPFDDSSFHMALDKGTMDALLKDKIKGHTKAVAMMSQVKRILTPGGRFVQISDEDPDTRLMFLDNLSRTYCDVRDSHVSDQQAAAGPVCTQPSGDSHCCPASTDSSTGSNSISYVCGRLVSPWSFTVIPSRWHTEYFIYWQDQL